jgi:hypothetical protein
VIVRPKRMATPDKSSLIVFCQTMSHPRRLAQTVFCTLPGGVQSVNTREFRGVGCRRGYAAAPPYGRVWPRSPQAGSRSDQLPVSALISTGAGSTRVSRRYRARPRHWPKRMPPANPWTTVPGIGPIISAATVAAINILTYSAKDDKKEGLRSCHMSP